MLRNAVIHARELAGQMSLIQNRVEEKLKRTKTTVASCELLPGDIAATVPCATAADAIEHELGRPLITVNRLALNYFWGQNEVTCICRRSAIGAGPSRFTSTAKLFQPRSRSKARWQRRSAANVFQVSPSRCQAKSFGTGGTSPITIARNRSRTSSRVTTKP